MLGTGDAAVNRTDRSPALRELRSSGGNKQGAEFGEKYTGKRIGGVGGCTFK